MIVAPFPAPPPLVAHALGRLRALRTGDPAELAALHPANDVARPWDPARCSSQLREQIWWWCDDVVAWINRYYAWRPVQLIPACWPAHAHIAAELPVLACLRADAEEAIAPDLLEDWHRDALPHFLDRMIARLGESGCRTGAHVDWPAAARHNAYTDDAAIEDRQRRIHADAHADRSPASPANGG